MSMFRKVRISMADVLMLVLAAAAASALFARLRMMIKAKGATDHWDLHVPAVLVLAIVLTCVAIGSWRRFSLAGSTLCATSACLQILSLILLAETAKTAPTTAKAMLYWLQACFALTVVAPGLALRSSWAGEFAGTRRAVKNACEALIASFAAMVLVMIGAMLQFLGAELLGALL